MIFPLSSPQPSLGLVRNNRMRFVVIETKAIKAYPPYWEGGRKVLEQNITSKHISSDLLSVEV